MGIFRTNNPLEYDEVDGIVIDEQAPAPSVRGVGTGTVVLVGMFQRGPHTLELISSMPAFHAMFGKSNSYSGNVQLKNKRFSRLKIIRVEATGSVKGVKTFQNATPADAITFTAKHKGVYGNSIQVQISAGSVSGKKYTVKDIGTGASEFFPTETYDNIAIASITASTFAASKLVDVAVVLNTTEPADTVGFTSLLLGTDGTVVDVDYETAIVKAEAQKAGNVLILDVNNQVRNAYLKVHAALTQDKMVICAEEEGDTVADNVSDVAILRDSDGRVIYASNWVKTLVDGVDVYTNPAAWLASIISQTSPHLDPAYSGNTQFLAGARGLKKSLTRIDFTSLKESGVASFELDEDIGFKLVSGVVTQIANSSKIMIFRRRMADYLTDSIGKFMKVYQNDVNSAPKRRKVKAAIVVFDKQQEDLGILPRDIEVVGGKAKLIDTDSENTNETIAAGKFIILYKRRIYSSMRFIVLKAEIGESVVVTESEEA